MTVTLNDIEIRVLGVLLEKSLSQPGSYPMTLNAILLAANQKQNREPVLNLRESAVATALHTLAVKQLVKQAAPAASARANRFEHCVVDRLQWDRREQAVMAELMLRGRQTAGELRTRASRMCPLPDLESVGAVLHGLATSDPPYVKELRREPGRSTTRFRHLLSKDAAAEPGVEAGFGSIGEQAVPPVDADRGSLDDRVIRLEAQVAWLMQTVEELRKAADLSVDRVDTPAVESMD